MLEVLEEADALGAEDALNACRLAAAPTPPTAGENDSSNDGPIPPKRVLVGCVATELSWSVAVVFAVRAPAGIVALLPPGSEIVPPAEAIIG